ncbi:MAG: hypothetical protein AABX38_05675 [Candidatus Micrarchaeota archaeon]
MFVFDSSTLILLAKTEILDQFMDNYQKKVVIPQRVFEESCNQKMTFDSLLIKKRVEEGKISIRNIKDKNMVAKISNEFGLGSGESEAIVLCLEQKAELIGLDDRLGINACKILKIPFTNALAILIRLYEKGRIDKQRANAILGRLIYYGRYSKEFIEIAKMQLGE